MLKLPTSIYIYRGLISQLMVVSSHHVLLYFPPQHPQLDYNLHLHHSFGHL